jgi:chlorite dismutase
MPVPDPSSSVNERPDSLLPVDNVKAEVIKNCAAAALELFTNASAKGRSSLFARDLREKRDGLEDSFEQVAPVAHVLLVSLTIHDGGVSMSTPEQTPAPQAPKRQYVNFAFYKIDPAWRRLPESERTKGKQEFLRAVEDYAGKVLVVAYSSIGIRGDCDIMLWRISYELELFQDMTTKILASGLGQYLTTPYSYLAITKRSVYVDHHTHENQESKRLTVVPGKAKYIFVYPFLKTREWFLLTKAARQGMMDEHIEVGHRFPSVKLNTSYSFGLDDQEWVVAFESDKPEDFLDLVMALRETEGSRYTLRDTPIFTCIRKSLKEMLDTLGG